jgi:hypothetical protein
VKLKHAQAPGSKLETSDTPRIVDADCVLQAIERGLVRAIYMAFKLCPPECEESDLVKKPFQNHKHDNIMVELIC